VDEYRRIATQLRASAHIGSKEDARKNLFPLALVYVRLAEMTQRNRLTVTNQWPTAHNIAIQPGSFPTSLSARRRPILGPPAVTVEETAAVYGVSRAHLRKVVNTLTRGGYLTAVRGRPGGLKLAKNPAGIRLGDLIRLTEPDFALVECSSTTNQCIVTARCRLRGVLKEGLVAIKDFLLRPKDFDFKSAA
jgi:Rrf2 family nitric oxide-sensitive transcriptional repressor